MGLNKYQCLAPDVLLFHPGNKRLLNEENDDNPKTTDIPQSEKDDTSHTSRDDYYAKVKDTKNTNDDDEQPTPHQHPNTMHAPAHHQQPPHAELADGIKWHQ